ncbi:Yip4p, partial [Ascoidea rubescens DSM 1968]
NNQIYERQYTGENTLDEPVLQTLSRDLKKIGYRLISVIWPNSLRTYVKSQQNNLLTYARNAGLDIDNMNLNLNINMNIPNIRFSSFANPSANNNDNTTNDNRIEQDIETSALDSLNINPLDWDLWGPLIFILFYSILITIKSSSSALSNSNDSTTRIFSSSFSIIWIAFFLISINIQLLGGKISLFLALSSIGYCLFPLDILALVSIFVKWYIVKFILCIVFTSWSIYSCSVALSCSGILPNRSFLAIYPVCLCYIALGWMCVVS